MKKIHHLEQNLQNAGMLLLNTSILSNRQNNHNLKGEIFQAITIISTPCMVEASKQYNKSRR